MKLTKKILTVLACGMLAATGMTGMSASAATTYVDNDDLGDSRMQSTGNYTGSNEKYYVWNLVNDRVTAKKKISLKLYAYVNDYRFTDPATKYYAVTMVYASMGTLNQNTASGGWNLVGTKALTPSSTLGEHDVTLTAAKANPGTQSGYNTGADGIRFTTTVYNS